MGDFNSPSSVRGRRTSHTSTEVVAVMATKPKAYAAHSASGRDGGMLRTNQPRPPQARAPVASVNAATSRLAIPRRFYTHVSNANPDRRRRHGDAGRAPVRFGA